MNKPYKAVDPAITINKIRNILTECGIFLIEDQNVSTSDFYSSRLIISNNGLFKLGIGQNGKGLTPEYSLASAYGEFMERLQNYNIFVNGISYARKENSISRDKGVFPKLLENNLILDFIFDPKEKRMSYDELTQRQKEICENIAMHNRLVASELSFKDSEKKLFVPFYCVKERCSEFLPIGLIYMEAKSNGMCAGNTKEEAILQGICEIFERYVTKMIYKHEITPPNIPTTLFKGTKIYELINRMEEDNEHISIIIKDCSLDKGLPVIGLLIINHERNAYAFHLGADPSPIVALERCFTELFQCRQLEHSLIKIDISRNPFSDSPSLRKKRINEEFFKFIADGTGILPNSILSSNCSYDFKELNLNLCKSDKEDLAYFLNKIDELGFYTYIRDVSFLSFPSFFVYIPGMSEISTVFDIDEVCNKRKSTYTALYNIKNNTLDEYIQAIEILERESNPNLRLFPYNSHKNNYIDRIFLLSLIYYRISDFSKSYEKLSVMIDTFDSEEISQNIYLLCSRDYIYHRSKGFLKNDIVALLKNIYKPEILSEVIDDLENDTDIFRYQNFPTCFYCDDCKIKEECYYMEVLKIMKTIQEKHRNNQINQDNLKLILEI